MLRLAFQVNSQLSQFLNVLNLLEGAPEIHVEGGIQNSCQAILFNIFETLKFGPEIVAGPFYLASSENMLR